MIKKLSLLFIIVALAFSACNTNDVVGEPALDPLTGESYFFLREGRFKEYEVFEIRYKAVDISDTLRYQLREEVKESFTNDNGDVSHIIHRLTRADENAEWQLDSVWSARVADQAAISVENNVPYIKILFPPVETRRWDGNLFNSANEDLYNVELFSPIEDNSTSFRVPQFPGENSVSPIFTEVLVIEQENSEDDITFRDIRTEVYQDSTGLVYKSYNVVKLCSRPECIGQQLVESGRLYREILINEGEIDD